MPPSSDQDYTNSPSGDSKPSKLSQKGATAGVPIPSKKERKNGTAKDSSGGGVLAAVTKSKASKAAGQPAQAQSPETKPSVPSSNGNNANPPLLDVLSSAALTQGQSPSPPSQNTQEWARTVPAYSSSPNNLINLGDSPPIFNYEEKLANLGWNTRDQRGLPSNSLPSASPPGRRRPLSYQVDGNYPPNPDDHRSQISSYAARRSSMYSQQARYPQPPLPHHAQPHFYGAPDADILFTPRTMGITAGDKGYFAGFDSLGKEHVVLAGYEGGIKVHSVSKRGLSPSSGIEGLRGGVYGAKILPWTIQGASAQHFPLIALVIHGPVWSRETSSADEAFPMKGSPPTSNGSIRATTPASSYDHDEAQYFQTTVEIYSLSGAKSHIATLLAFPEALVPASPSKAHSPVGALTIRADNGIVVVASAVSGECWIFRQGSVDRNATDKFKCIAKVWTTVQHGAPVESPSGNGLAESDWATPHLPHPREPFKAPVLALNGRWLAYCPSTPSSQVCLKAVVPCSSSSTRAHSIGTRAPPHLPTVNCEVDIPEGESVMKQYVQAGAQKIIEAGNWFAEQGIQYWNGYRNKATVNQPANGGANHQQHHVAAQQFPPTHGIATPAPLVSKDPGLVSILDLETLARQSSSHSSSPHPIATFKVPHGCSFLSLAPSGLALFTASSKGDVQSVWDLMRLQYARSSFLKAGLPGSEPQNPHVRQIAQFSRMTIARIVDVVWTSPHGERAAMVTVPGTIHILDLPASAFTWPPPRRRNPIPRFEDGRGDGAGATLTATAAGAASNAVNLFRNVARPLVNRRRRSSGTIAARAVKAQAGQAAQVAVAGFSRSVDAMNGMRVGNRPHLPNSKNVPSPGCVLLLNGKRNDTIIALGGGTVCLYTIKNRRADRPAGKQKASIKMAVEYQIPRLPDTKVAREISPEIQRMGDLDLTEKDIDEVRWKGRSPPPRPSSRGMEAAVHEAEIESNAPYQPFHTDRRVALYTFSHNESLPPSPSVSALLSTQRIEQKTTPGDKPSNVWVFGGPIKAVKMDVGPPQNPEEYLNDSSYYQAQPSSSIERVLRSDNSDDREQIVITTRRRKGRLGGTDETGSFDEEGFFEDDCEVLDFASQRV